MAFYAKDPRIGGISLYNYRLNEFNNLDFRPVADGADVYFLPVASSWGQAWTADQWNAFRRWCVEDKDRPFSAAGGLPRQLQAWKPTSWKKCYIKYLVETGRYFVYPRASLSTNTARSGAHTKRVVSIYQTPLDLARARQWRLARLDASLAVYDVFYEPTREALAHSRPELAGLDFDVDLMGTKPANALSKPFLLSPRPCRLPMRQYGIRGGSTPTDDIADGAAGRLFSFCPATAFGAMTPLRRLKLIRAVHGGFGLGKLAFQILKPLQTELFIAQARRRAAPAPALPMRSCTHAPDLAPPCRLQQGDRHAGVRPRGAGNRESEAGPGHRRRAPNLPGGGPGVELAGGRGARLAQHRGPILRAVAS
ncbi:hypothetical protein [Caulobacter sp. DWP3-1-3b2]|uniref:hypothetical protein n=1 Tax=Caulobacter sp. DWP3-1-3b2 TaxID=2804643 RepID=UPI003CFAB431